MEEKVYILMLLFLLLTSATTTAFIAKKMGRSFWLWLIISPQLSMISIFILLWLPSRQTMNDDQREN